MTPPGVIGLLVGGTVDCTLELFLALREHAFALVDFEDNPRAWPLRHHPLPIVAGGCAVLVGSHWARQASDRGMDVANVMVPRLRQAFGRVVGLDQEASFGLEFPDDVLAALDAVIKPNGVYRDPDLYRYVVGARTREGRWTQRTVRRARSGAFDYGRLHLSVPGFVTESREMRSLARRRAGRNLDWLARGAAERTLAAAARPIEPRRPPRGTAHFMGTLTHVQRADALRRIRRAGLRLAGGITGVSGQVNGLDGDGPAQPTPEQRRSLLEGLRAEGLATRRLSRWRYRLSMRDCKAVVSIAGHGEICYRMAETWAMRRVLVCQDLSHARTLFPFAPGGNVVFCRPDLGDLVEILDDIECNLGRYVDVAEQGHRDWRRWSRQAPELLRAGFLPLGQA